MVKLFEIVGDDPEERRRREQARSVRIGELILALEHQTYKNIPGTVNSYRYDSANTTTGTQGHFHVFAKRNGKGEQLYAVNMDGSGHDGSSGTTISRKQADYLRSKGVQVPLNLTLESIDYDDLNGEEYTFVILE